MAFRACKILHLLIDYGANVIAGKKPFIFDAIDSMNLGIVSLLVQMGTDRNISATFREGEGRYRDYFLQPIDSGNSSEKNYPVHFAASARYNTNTSRPRMIPIIECLIRGGADPFRLHNHADSILHDLCSRDGIIELFLENSNMNLEARDSHGRTLLLATCSRSEERWRSNEDARYLETLPTSATLLLSKGAKIEALDVEKRNALHCVLAGISNPNMR